MIHTRTYVTEDGVTVVAVGARKGIEDTKPQADAEFVFKDDELTGAHIGATPELEHLLYTPIPEPLAKRLEQVLAANNISPSHCTTEMLRELYPTRDAVIELLIAALEDRAALKAIA